MHFARMAVRAQVEFYFGDANLSKDRFLGTKIAESSDGCLRGARKREFYLDRQRLKKNRENTQTNALKINIRSIIN